MSIEAMKQALVDEDGENRAVRWFLAAYLNPGMSVGGMKAHLKLSGYPLWPDWVERCHPSEHLTKAGAQLWIRHLFSLEATPLAAPVQDSTCSETLRAQGKAYPRTCKKCGKGPCIGAPKQSPTAQRQWVGLTDEDYKQLGKAVAVNKYQCLATEALLREKNGGGE